MTSPIPPGASRASISSCLCREPAPTKTEPKRSFLHARERGSRCVRPRAYASSRGRESTTRSTPSPLARRSTVMPSPLPPQGRPRWPKVSAPGPKERRRTARVQGQGRGQAKEPGWKPLRAKVTSVSGQRRVQGRGQAWVRVQVWELSTSSGEAGGSEGRCSSRRHRRGFRDARRESSTRPRRKDRGRRLESPLSRCRPCAQEACRDA